MLLPSSAWGARGAPNRRSDPAHLRSGYCQRRPDLARRPPGQARRRSTAPSVRAPRPSAPCADPPAPSLPGRHLRRSVGSIVARPPPAPLAGRAYPLGCPPQPLEGAAAAGSASLHGCRGRPHPRTRGGGLLEP